MLVHVAPRQKLLRFGVDEISAFDEACRTIDELTGAGGNFNGSL